MPSASATTSDTRGFGETRVLIAGPAASWRDAGRSLGTISGLYGWGRDRWSGSQSTRRPGHRGAFLEDISQRGDVHSEAILGAKLTYIRRAEHHVQLTGHRVEVSLHFDMRDDHWLEKITPERRAELDAVRAGDVARDLAQQLLADTRH